MYQHAYVQRRNRELTADAFRRRWRAHYDIATTCETYWLPVAAYVQNDVLADCLEEVACLDRSFDAVGEFFYTERAAREAVANVDRAAIRDDARTLFDIQPTTLFFGGEYCHLTGLTEAPFKLFRLLARRRDVAYDTFAPALETAVHAHAVGLGAGAALSCGSDRHFAFAGAVMIWFDDLADIADALSSDDWVDFAQAIEGTVDLQGSLTLLAGERVLQRGPLR